MTSSDDNRTPRIEAGRGDLAERAERIMDMMRQQAVEDEAAGIGLEPPPQVTDTIYYAVRHELLDPHTGARRVVAIALRGMHPRVPMFEVQAEREEQLDRRLVNAYLDAMINVGVPRDEARTRAGTCKLEMVDREMVPLYARGVVQR